MDESRFQSSDGHDREMCSQQGKPMVDDGSGMSRWKIETRYTSHGEGDKMTSPT